MEKQKNGLGRRKEAVTRVFLSKGNGSITVNDLDYKQYFPQVYLQNQVELSIKTIDGVGKYDIKINAAGGGKKGQAEAAKLGIARALITLNPEFRPAIHEVLKGRNSVRRKREGASSSASVNSIHQTRTKTHFT